MSERKILDSYKKDIDRCVRCGTCKKDCPSFMVKQTESRSARGRMALVKAVAEGRLPVSRVFKDRLATCTECLACEVSCPSNVPVTEIIRAAKEQAVSESGPNLIGAMLSGVLKNDLALRSLAWLAPIALHYTGTSFRKNFPIPFYGRSFTDTVPEVITAGNSRGRLIFFAGCAANYFQQDMARAAVSVLSRFGYEIIVPKDQKCCGRPMQSLGDRKSAQEQAERNAALFSRIDADAVVTLCASCGLTFKRDYAQLLPRRNTMPRILDIHEILSEHIGHARFDPITRSVTFHDPCHLGKGQGLSGTAREVLRSIPGLQLVEMKNAERCCGFGGSMRITHHECSSAIGVEKANDIIETKASMVATGCPGCRMQIIDALRRQGSDLDVVHTVQIVEEAMEKKPGDLSMRREDAALMNK